MRKNRKLLAILMVLLLVGSTITFQLGLKIRKDAELEKLNSIRAHDSALSNKIFSENTAFETLYNHFKEWYIADYKFDNKNSDKTDLNILNVYEWTNPKEVMEQVTVASFIGDTSKKLVSSDLSSNSLDGWVSTSVKEKYATQIVYNDAVDAITDFDAFETIYNSLKITYKTLELNCKQEESTFALTTAKICLKETIPAQAWTDGKASTWFKVVQQEVTYTESQVEKNAYFNVDMAKALGRLERYGSDRLKRFTRIFKDAFAKRLEDEKTNASSKYRIVAGEEFAQNAINKEMVKNKDIKFR